MMSFPEAARMFRDSWGLYRKYYGQEKDKKMWGRLVEEAEELYVKYGKQPFAKELIAAVISEVERIDKRQ